MKNENNAMCHHPSYHDNGFDNIYQNIKIKHNREMVGKIYPNMKLTPPCTPLTFPVKLSTWERLG